MRYIYTCIQSETYSSTHFPPQPAATICYPALDDQQPPPYEGEASVGTLIDLGSDITAPLPPQSTPEGQDIVSQLKDLGITGGQSGPQQSAAPAAVEQSHDEFDMFAKSRTAYAGPTGYVSLDYCMDIHANSLSLLGALRTKI